MTEEPVEYAPDDGKQRLSARTIARRARDEALLAVGKAIYQQYLRRARASSGNTELDAVLVAADEACSKLAQLD